MTENEPYYQGLSREGLPARRRNPVYVVLDNLRSAYNVGSIFRTADAGAVEHIYLCGMSAHPPHKKLEKTALGAFEYVPWSYHERTTAVLDSLAERDVPCTAVEVTDRAVSMTDVSWPRPVAVVFGNEVTGVSDRVLRRCDSVVRIPMLGFKNTINVATAFGIVLYDVLGKWRVLGD